MRGLLGNVPHPCIYFLAELSDPEVGPVAFFFFFFFFKLFFIAIRVIVS